jgi:hypothetical protein
MMEIHILKLLIILNEEKALGKDNWRDSTITIYYQMKFIKETSFMVKEQKSYLL